MSRNDTADFTQRLYSRVPGQYRVYDQEQGYPLLALLRVVGEQAASLRQDLDALWDNFFIETCDDWVVPYLGALVGTNLLANPVGQSNRLDVRNTVVWRRTKGTPRMLASLARAITGWPVDLAEFFQSLGWSQNMNHLRMDHPLTPDLRDNHTLSLLGRAADPLAHAADFKVAHALDQPWGARSTPGRYQIRNIGLFARRLRTFPVRGATPAPLTPACFTFDPLERNVPLFVSATGEPLTRAAFAHAPWETFGSELAVRQFGVLLASDAAPQPAITNSRVQFNFGGLGAGLRLHTTAGLRLMDARDFSPSADFTIAAQWQSAGPPVTLGALSTRTGKYTPGAAAAGTGALAFEVRAGALAPGGRFPGATIAVRAERSGPPRTTDALYVYLPALYVPPGSSLRFYVADDGSTYTSPDLISDSLARSAEGQLYPPRVLVSGNAPASRFTALNRQSTGMLLPDETRFGGAAILVRADLFTGAFQPMGAVATATQPAPPPGFPGPSPWPAFTYLPSIAAIADNLPSDGLLAVHVAPLAGNFIPASELALMNRSGDGLLVYLPELAGVGAEGKDLFVASDGSTYFAPADPAELQSVLSAKSLAGLPLARASAGQALPVRGTFPLEQRRPVALDLCRPERRSLLKPGELGIDPQLGRFAFAPDDPVIGSGGLSVDYAEAFSDRVGALNFDRQLDPAKPATRLVSHAGDASGAPVHSTVSAAVAAAQDGDVVEIIDSATYTESAAVVLGAPLVKSLVLRAAKGQRPCLRLNGGLQVTVPMDRLELNGLLLSGVTVRVESAVRQLYAAACTLGSLLALDPDLNTRAEYLLCRCITGPLRLAPGVGRITIADSIVDGGDGVAIAGVEGVFSPPFSPLSPLSPPSMLLPPAGTVQLERVTVFGRVRCDVLNASESLLASLVTVEDQQAGCIRFSRYEPGSVLPRRFQCLTSRPLFNSLRLERPDYAQLAAGAPYELLSAGENGAEVGAFAGALNTIRLQNLEIKLREFLPAGLTAVLIGET